VPAGLSNQRYRVTGPTSTLLAMLYFVIERFKSREAAAEVYERFAKRGRMLPEGLHYIDSWVEENLDRCFQLMETDDASLFDKWIACWNDLVEFEVVSVTKSSSAAERATTISEV
jgi:hypothetical protein